MSLSGRNHPLLSKPSSLLGLLCAATTLGALAEAQGQPSTTRSRSAGLEVYGHVTSPAPGPGGVQMVVHGRPGSPYILGVDSSPFSVDFQTPFPGLIGSLSLATPILVGLGGVFTAPPGQALGVIGPQGTQTLTSTFTLPPGFPNPLFWQAFVVDGVGTPLNPGPSVYATNPQSRIATPPIAVPSGTGYTTGPALPFSGGFIRDVEQADIDGDGDLDTFVLFGNATGRLYVTVQQSFPATKTLASAALLTFPGMLATNSAEFVDLDDDGFPELVVGGSGTQYLMVAQNGGLAAPGTFTVNQPGSTVLQPAFFNVNDIESADTNGDGLPDVAAATGLAPCVGEINLLFYNTTPGPGRAQLTDVTQATMPLQAEDTEDMEFFDYDLDGDLDMVMGNFDGPPAIEGQNFIYTNVNGRYNAIAPLRVGAPAETLDVVAEDIDLDGLPDLYFGNWLLNAGCGQAFTAVQFDQLLLNRGGGIFNDVSQLLPDNLAYTGPTPVRPWTSIDAEAVRMPVDQVASGVFTPKDYDHDGDVDIFVALGSFGNPNPLVATPVAGLNRGVLILQNQQADQGLTPGAGLPSFVIDATLTTSSPTAGVLADYNDIELGDWFIFNAPSMQWYEKDVGGGTINVGHFVMKKNNG